MRLNRLTLLIVTLIPLTSYANPTIPGPLPSDVPSEIRDNTKTVGERFLTLEECEFLVQVFDPNDSETTQLGLCFYEKSEQKGIFKDTACIASMVEPYAVSKKSFYGSTGDWGVVGKCEKDAILKEFDKKRTKETNNPLTAFKLKREQGMIIRPLRDKIGIWPEFQKRTTPLTSK
jgi:hypothetical protein